MPFAIMLALGVIFICALIAAAFGLSQGDEPFSYGIGGCVLGVILVGMGAMAYFTLKAFAAYLIPICFIAVLLLLVMGYFGYRGGLFRRERWATPPAGELVYRFKGTSNTRDVLGPLELEDGVYIMQYRMRGDEYSTPAVNILIENIGSADLIDANAVVATEVKGMGPMDIRAASDTRGGLCEGKESVRLAKGYYLIKLRFEQVKQWELTLYRADVRKEKPEA